MGTENDPEGTNGDQKPQKSSFDDLVKRGAHTLGASKDDDTAEDFLAAYTSPADLLGAGAEDDIAAIRETNPKLADDLEGFRKQAQEAAERAQEVEAKAERDDRKAHFQGLPADQRTPEDDTDRALIEELAQEEYESSPQGQVESQADATVQEIFDINTAIRTGKIPFDSGYEQLQSKLDPVRALADAVTDRSRTTAERVDLWNAADPVTRRVAETIFYIPPNFNLDPDSPEYAAGVEERRKANSADLTWAAQQLGLETEE